MDIYAAITGTLEDYPWDKPREVDIKGSNVKDNELLQSCSFRIHFTPCLVVKLQYLKNKIFRVVNSKLQHI